MKEEFAQCAVEAALKAGKILRDGFGSVFTISNKEGKNNFVTEFDKLSEKKIIDYISSRYPDHFFLAEESGSTGAKNNGAVRWIIDPLDGTTNFAHNLPIFSISIAAEYNGELLCGVIYQPILDELFLAIRNKGAFLNNSPIQVSSNNDFDSSFLVTGFPYNINQNPCHCIDNFVDIILRGIPVRRLGSAALDLAYVAAGRFDGFWEINLNPWDIAAGVILVEEAGGVVTQYDGNPYKIGCQSILATNGKIHDSISGALAVCSCGIEFE
jgi:myo-inositol-1(or 4)-monophosphatase